MGKKKQKTDQPTEIEKIDPVLEEEQPKESIQAETVDESQEVQETKADGVLEVPSQTQIPKQNEEQENVSEVPPQTDAVEETHEIQEPQISANEPDAAPESEVSPEPVVSPELETPKKKEKTKSKKGEKKKKSSLQTETADESQDTQEPTTKDGESKKKQKSKTKKGKAIKEDKPEAALETETDVEAQDTEEPTESEAPKKKEKSKSKKGKEKKAKVPTQTDTQDESQEIEEATKPLESKKKGSIKKGKKSKSAGVPKDLGADKSTVQFTERGESDIQMTPTAFRRQSVIRSDRNLMEYRSSSRLGFSRSSLTDGRRLSRLSYGGSSRHLIRKYSYTRRFSRQEYDDYEESSSSEEEDKEEKKKGKKGKKGKGAAGEDDKGKKKKGKKGKKGKKETTSTEEAETVAEPEEKEKKEKKKKKKGKKAKKKAEPTVKAKGKDGKEIIDWVAELKRLKALAVEQGLIEPEKEEKRKGGKKKMSKKEKAKMAVEQADKAKAEAEAQCKILEEMLRKKAEEDKKAAIEKDKREIAEQQWRMEQLEGSSNMITDMIQYNLDLDKIEKNEYEWQKYVACRKLPDPALCAHMNTYLHLWEQQMDETKIEDASKRTVDVMELLNELDELLQTSVDITEEAYENMIWVRSLFREHQQKSLDVATYLLLRDVEHNLNRIDIPTADFNYKDDNITVCIWLRVMLPIPLPNPRRPPKPRIDVRFELMDMDALLPIAIDGENAALRAMYLKYDHLSDTSKTFQMPEPPREYYRDFLESMKNEWRVKLKYKYDHRDKLPPKEPEEVKTDAETGEQNPEASEVVQPEKEKEDFESDEEIPVVPFKQLKPTSSDHLIAKEDNLYQETKEKLTYNLPEHIVNLRKFTVIGGIYYLNYLAQPPQPQDFITMEMELTALYLPKQLENVPFNVTYIPPQPQSSDPELRKPPEELEEDMKKQEEELEKLIAVNINWPQHVIFLELPLVCKWDETEKCWCREDIHDLKHNEEKCLLSFRTGSFGIFGLATYRYSNLPFQAYDLKPEANGSVTLQLTAAILMLEFNIKDGLICMTQLQNSPNMALQDLIGVYMKLHRLTKIMKEAGIDIFPSVDAFLYVENNAEKQWPMEQHLYYNMAQMSHCFNFAWSRWNMQAGRRKIVMQMRQFQPTKPKQVNHQMVLVTPEKATLVDCTEVSPVFSETDLESVLRYSADLFNLMKNTYSISVRNKVLQSPKENVYILSQFLISTRILSFS